MATSLRLEGPTLHIEGPINEGFAVGALPDLRMVARLDFRGATYINTVGVHRFLAFIALFAGRRLEYSNCAIELITSFTVLPALLGPDTSTAVVTSVIFPYSCASCRSEVNAVVPGTAIGLKAGGELVLPSYGCPKCGTGMQADQHAVDNLHDLVELKALSHQVI
jgi:hypothetical protein